MSRDKYAGLTQEVFSELLRDIVHEENPSAADLLDIPGVYEAASEFYNNAVLERFEQENPAPEPDDEEGGTNESAATD